MLGIMEKPCETVAVAQMRKKKIRLSFNSYVNSKVDTSVQKTGGGGE